MAKIPGQREYEHREITAAHRQADEIRHASLADRKEAQLEFFKAMRDSPGLVGERLGWMFEGNYGYGPMLLAKDLLRRKRMNRVAGLTQMVGIYEWQCPEEMTRQAWKRLTPGEKHELARAIEHAMDEARAADDED